MWDNNNNYKDNTGQVDDILVYKYPLVSLYLKVCIELLPVLYFYLTPMQLSVIVVILHFWVVISTGQI